VLIMIGTPRRSTPFPYTTLFRSEGNGDRALEVLSQYRATPEGSDDQGAQTQSIDLYLVKLGTVDKQIEYLKDVVGRPGIAEAVRSEEHTSELQSRGHLVCRLLLE